MTAPFTRLIALLGLLFLVPTLAPAQSAPTDIPEPYRSLPARLQARRADFPKLPAPTDAGELKILAVPLNRAPEIFENGQAFDAIRFRAPDKPGLDLVWAFSAPREWRQWYILPAEGDATKRGFKNWLNGDRAYVGFDCSLGNPVTLQTLDADYFEPGREYLLWFSQNPHTPAPAELKLVLRFAPRPEGDKGWDNEAIEKALALETAPAAAQAEYFASRGARVLLDRDLFHPEDAKNQIDDLLFTRRQTEFTRGGYYMTIESTCPPCRSSPKFSDIVARHGPPDVTLTAALQNRLRAPGRDPADGPAAENDRHYYDYFVFETAAGDASGPVLRVSAQYFDTASARPAAVDSPGDTWTEATLVGRSFRLFFRDGREVGRYVDWDEPSALPVSVAPAGEYLRHYPSGEPMEKLVHDGSGGWTYESRYRSGPVYRRCTYKANKLEGELTDLFENGRKRNEAHYREGLLHGYFGQWTEDGSLQGEREYAGGKPVAAKPAPAPAH